MFQVVFLVLGLCYLPVSQAEVVHAAESGFEIKMSVPVAATPEQAYAQFLKIDEWWSPKHTWFGKAENLSIEPRAGGCFCERAGDESVLHMTVAYVSPNREVRLLGGLGPLQQMGLQGVLTFKFIPVSDNETRIVQIYRVTGYDPNGLKALAPIVDKVQTLQLDRLRDRFTARL
jgi:uncharacterized protein YndB with AHSA1/START domain